MPNPYAQVALTYVRRPFSSWRGRIISFAVILMLIPSCLVAWGGSRQEVVFPLVMSFVFLFVWIAAHAKGQFADSRAHLMPGFRRVHATVAAIAALVAAVILPAVLTLLLGWHSIGFVAVMVLLFGTMLWETVKKVAWIDCAVWGGWLALFLTESGQAGFRELVSGRLEPLAAALLGLGILINLLAAVRLVRLNEDMPGYFTSGRWERGWDQRPRQGWSDEKRFPPGLTDWIRERQMARLTLHARQASESWWSRMCRWQVGMPASWSLWPWILGALVYVHAMTWWIMPRQSVATAMEMTFFAMAFVPAIAIMGGIYSRMLTRGHELLLPVERKSYIRQWGAGAALSHFQLWGVLSVALALWWLATGPRPLPLAMLAGLLALATAFQVGVFGTMVWTARYRSRAMIGAVMGMLGFTGALLPMRWARASEGQPLHGIMWIAGIVAVLGLLITLDAYRRWLVADFD